MSFSFGTPSSAPATGLTGGFSFGANKPAAPSFGLSTSQPSTGLFGNTSTSTPAIGSTPAFGATTSAPTFGAATSAPAFGATTTPAFGASTTPAFGATTTPSFGQTAPTFGTATTSSFGLGTGGLNFGAGTNTSAPSTGLSFGTTTSTSSAPGLGGLGGFGFGSTATTQSSLGFLGTTSTASNSSTLFGAKLGTSTVTGTQAITTVTPSLGLGGIAPATTGASNATGDGKSEPPKQTKLPNEISTTVENFKEFVKKQKAMSSEIMRVSIKPLHKVSRDAEATLREAMSLSSMVSKARAQSRRLRAAAASALAAAETAVSDPPGSELESTAPPLYIKELISELEQHLIAFRRQMDEADKQMQASPKLLSEQELTLGIRRMHESLVALAGRLQSVHTQVEAQKEQYLNLRKYILKDPTNVFDTTSPSSSLDQILRDAEGTRKKAKSGNLTDMGFGSAVVSDPRAALGSIQQLAGPTPFTYFGNTLSPFPAGDASGSSWQPQPQQHSLSTPLSMPGFGAQTSTDTSGFQLQKPPGKRGKQ